MATLSYAFFHSVAIGPSYDIYPGDGHNWEMWGGGFNYGDAITVSAHPVGRRPGRSLAIEDVRISNLGESVLSFTVRNVGTGPIIGYGLGFAWVDQ